ncbi:MAG: carboxymuconolactone decarboxylase family protein [Thermomicrobiales bacterium]|nr:carboxymuconolactone decarboxylase family protein [Thermomicrobiales bacterium]
MQVGTDGKDKRVEPRMRAMQANPEVTKPMMAMGQAVHESGLDPMLIGLIEIRASQINGCGF